MVRGTGEAEKMLKNAKTEYCNEHEEIATYTAIETLAESLNDSDTAKMARSIRRDEERMARFLERQIPQLAKAVVREEVPASERRANGGQRKRRSSSSGRKSSRWMRVWLRRRSEEALRWGSRSSAEGMLRHSSMSVSRAFRVSCLDPGPELVASSGAARSGLEEVSRRRHLRASRRAVRAAPRRRPLVATSRVRGGPAPCSSVERRGRDRASSAVSARPAARTRR